MSKKLILDDISKTVEKHTLKRRHKDCPLDQIMVNEHIMRKPRFRKGTIITYLIMMIILIIIVVIFFI